MKNDDLQLLREFRAGIPAPGAMTRRTAYAYATSAGASRWQPSARRLRVRRWRSSRGPLVIAVAVLALASTAVAIGGRSLFGFSNHGTRVSAGPGIRRMLNGDDFKLAHLPYNTESPNTFKRLALRQGIGIYVARTKEGNHRCYYVGSRTSIPHLPPHKLYLDGYGCDPYAAGVPWRIDRKIEQAASGHKATELVEAWMRSHPFPSPARPVLDMSSRGDVRPRDVKREFPGQSVWSMPDFAGGSVRSVVGLAANNVRSIQLLSLVDCRVVDTVPVIDNVYIDAHPPVWVEAFLVARDANGKIVWDSPPFEQQGARYGLGAHLRIPTDRRVPRYCGLH